MKSLVVYSTQTENTKKLADTIHATLQGDKEIRFVEDAPEPGNYDFVAVGFWLMGGKPDPKAAAYLETLKDDQVVFLFATHGAAKGSGHVVQGMQVARDIVSGASVVGSYSCQGEVNPKVLAKVKAKPQPPVWLADTATAVGHPDEKDLAELKEIITALPLKR
ncbi:MAG: flavodoxin family protein [Desulfobacterales bacterium]|nr:flavodoxin family protein [Desulfobacterales bacterium]